VGRAAVRRARLLARATSVCDWIEAHCCHGEGDIQGQPAQVDPEMLDHIVECYRIDPDTGRRLYNEAVLSRPKGRAKSEIAAWVALAEAFADCVRFSHWDEDGQPVGRRVVSPLIKCLATEEGQAGNTFKTIAYIASEWGQEHHPEVYGGATGARQYQSASAIYLPHGGEIRACTAGSASKDGGLESHVVVDETHLFTLPELRNMYATISRNLGKRYDADPWLQQTSTAYKPGEQSVFEATLTMWRKGEMPESVYVNHREAKGRVDLNDKDHTLRQLRYVYGAAAGRIDMERKYRDMRDPRICRDDAEAARYFLNRPMSGNDAWIAKDLVERQIRRGDVIAPGEKITIGFDGSLNDDTTVLRGCRLSDGFRFRIGAWPKPRARPASAGKFPGRTCSPRSARRTAATTWSAATSTRTSGGRTSTRSPRSSPSGCSPGRPAATWRWPWRWTGCTPTSSTASPSRTTTRWRWSTTATPTSA
jgi:phage terminase large subunit-like protein